MTPVIKAEPDFNCLPASAVHQSTLNICLKCAFDFFTEQLGLAPRTAYIDLRRHVPEGDDISGAATVRPHFFGGNETRHCPYCSASRQWFARFYAYRVDAHPSFEKARKKLWTSLRKQPERFALIPLEQTGMQIFSHWLERVKAGLDLGSSEWMLEVAFAELARSTPSHDWATLRESIKSISPAGLDAPGWSVNDGVLGVSPLMYGGILLVQHLISRSQLQGGVTFEGRLTLSELMAKLSEIGYSVRTGLAAENAHQSFENAVGRLVASGPSAVYYAVDRSDYLKQLKSIYEKKRNK